MSASQLRDDVNSLNLIHEFESACLALRGFHGSTRGSLARRDAALNALLVAMGQPPIHRESL